MELSVKFDTVNSGWPIRYFEGLQGKLKKGLHFLLRRSILSQQTV